MAGIGFRLERLLRDDTYTSLARGYAYSAAISAGPWLFTIAALGFVAVFAPGFLTPGEQALFRATVVYAYATSLVATGFYQMVASRYLADRIWLKDASAILPGFVTLLVLTSVPQAAIAGAAALALGLAPGFGLAAVGLYVVVTALWITIIFLSAAKDYESVTVAFGVGSAISMAGAVALGRVAGLEGCAFGFLAGQLATLILLVGRIFREFPAERALDWGILGALSRYRDLALTGLFYNLGIWIDKLVFACSPLGATTSAGLRTHSAYEGAMFLAYLTVIPSLALFLIRIETSFYVSYRDFFAAIVAHRPLGEVRARRDAIAQKLRISVVRLLKLQGTITMIAIAFAPGILDAAGFDPLQVLTFRIGALAAFLQVLFLLLLICLQYFEHRGTVLGLAVGFCLLNGALSSLTTRASPAWHGYGYAGACLAGVIVAYIAFDRAVADLDFETFSRQPLFPETTAAAG